MAIIEQLFLHINFTLAPWKTEKIWINPRFFFKIFELVERDLLNGEIPARIMIEQHKRKRNRKLYPPCHLGIPSTSKRIPRTFAN